MTLPPQFSQGVGALGESYIYHKSRKVNRQEALDKGYLTGCFVKQPITNIGNVKSTKCVRRYVRMWTLVLVTIAGNGTNLKVHRGKPG